jgi:hypothetical protein
MPKLKLTYFDLKGGRGEPARLALSIGVDRHWFNWSVSYVLGAII